MIDYSLPSITLNKLHKDFCDAARKNKWTDCNRLAVEMVQSCQLMGKYAEFKMLGYSPTK